MQHTYHMNMWSEAKILKRSAASEKHFKSIPMLGRLTQRLWVRPL